MIGTGGRKLAGLLLVLAACAPAPVDMPIVTASPGLAVGAEATQAPESLIPLKVGSLPQASNAPFYIAKEEGYYEQEGLDVEIVRFQSGASETIPALARGDIDVLGTILSPSVLNAISQGINMKFVSDRGFINPDSCPTSAWVASKQALAGGLKGPADLKGKKVLVEQRPDTVMYAQSLLLARSGLTVNDVVPIEIGDSSAVVEALRTGALDMGGLAEPWITVAETSGAGEVWRPLSDVIPGMPLGLVAFGPGILDKNPEAGVRFLAAYLRAVRQYDEGKTDRNIQIISDFTKLTSDQVRQMCWSSFKPDGSVDTEGMLTFQQWLLDNGMVDQKLELRHFWTDSFLAEAQSRLGN